MTRHEVCALDELEPGQMRAVDLDGTPIVVIRTQSGDLHALRDRCPHMLASLSKGLVLENVNSPSIGHYELDDDRFVVRCPWHGYEFDVSTGVCEADPRRAKVRSYPLVVDDGTIYLER
jgi:nitrite reductase/ring-hydroxylating ferredoxin subunit